MSEPKALKLPDKTRIALAELYRNAQQAQKEFVQAMGIACDMLGLDATQNHGVDFATGIITPAPSPAKPTLVKEEATG